MKIIIPVSIAMTVIIGIFLTPSNGIAFAVGATLSAVAGIVSLKITVKAAVRAANLSGSGLGKTFVMAFRGGATVGLVVPAMALLAITGLYMIYPDPITIAGVGIGASLIALFIRIGGGIFTKAADMGADLVGKVEVNIPEDDPRNPATIADNVGDNVGDAAGMGSDIYESYIITVLAALLIAALIGAPNFFLYPLLIGSSGMLASIVGVVIIGSKNVKDVMKPLNRSFYVSAAIAIVLNLYIHYTIHWRIKCSICFVWFNCHWCHFSSSDSKNYKLLHQLQKGTCTRNCRVCKMGICIININGNYQRHAINWTIYDYISYCNYRIIQPCIWRST